MTDVLVRPYRSADHAAGRGLWAELVERHRQLHAGPGTVGDHQTASFEDYLTRLDLSGLWVAELTRGGVVGLVGLVVSGRGGRVEPVVVTQRQRGRGIGRTLLDRVAEEARRRRLDRLTVRPDARDVEALRCVRGAGYDVLSSVELTLDLARSPDRRRDDARHDDIELRGLRFLS